MSEDEERDDEDEDERDPDEQVELLEGWAEERDPVDREGDVGDLREVVRGALVAVVVQEDVARRAECEEVDREAADDLVGAE